MILLLQNKEMFEKWVGKVDQDKVDEHVKSVIDYLEGLKT